MLNYLKYNLLRCPHSLYFKRIKIIHIKFQPILRWFVMSILRTLMNNLGRTITSTRRINFNGRAFQIRFSTYDVQRCNSINEIKIRRITGPNYGTIKWRLCLHWNFHSLTLAGMCGKKMELHLRLLVQKCSYVKLVNRSPCMHICNMTS